jgi:hypothetical protein
MARKRNKRPRPPASGTLPPLPSLEAATADYGTGFRCHGGRVIATRIGASVGLELVDVVDID